MTPRPVGHPVDVAVGMRVRMIRQARGVTQQALADAVGVTVHQVRKYESGGNRVSASMLAELATVLEVSVAEFFGSEDAPTGLTDELTSLLCEPGALQLLRSFSRLPRTQQSALVSFIESLPARR